MKKYTYTIVLFLPLLFLKSCGEPEPIIYDGPLFVNFTEGTSIKYLVDDTNNTISIQVGIPLVQQQDITAGLQVLYSTATLGTHFYFPPSVTIPAGEHTAEFTFQGFYNELSGRQDTVVIGFTGEVMTAYDSAYTVNMRKLECYFDISELTGKWTVNETSQFDGEYAPYELTTVENPAGGDTIVVTDYWYWLEDYDAPFKIVFDVSDTNNITCHIPYQYQFDFESEGNTFAFYVESFQKGSFSKCYQVITDLGLQITAENAGIVDKTLLNMELQW